MNPWLSAAAGALLAYVVLILAVLWTRNACLPVSAGEAKWQCEVTLWAIAAAYLACAFIAAFLARRWRLGMGLLAVALVFAGHSALPDLGLISFRRGLRLHEHALYFALLPAALGMVAALVRRIRPSRPSG